MPRFEFRLRALKDFRSTRLLSAKKELMLIDDRILRLTGEMREAIDQWSEAVGDSQRVERLPEALVAAGLIDSQQTVIEHLKLTLKDLEEERERHKRWVTELGRELKVVEKLEEKKRAAWELEERGKEKRRVDGWVAEHWSRKEEDEE